MPLRLTKPGEKAKFGTSIPFETVLQMVKNFIKKTHKDKNGAIKKVTKDYDSHAVWYSKKEIDDLFAANTGAEGLRIYLGVHDNTPTEVQHMPRRKPGYMDQHTVILVCTDKDKRDMLDSYKDNAISAWHIKDLADGSALEEGEICPPPSCNGEIDDELKKDQSL